MMAMEMATLQNHIITIAVLFSVVTRGCSERLRVLVTGVEPFTFRISQSLKGISPVTAESV